MIINIFQNLWASFLQYFGESISTSAIVPAFIGGAVSFLVTSYINNQFKKSLLQEQNKLANKIEKLKYRLNVYEISKKTALEKIYLAIINTDIRKRFVVNAQNYYKNEQSTNEYVDRLSTLYDDIIFILTQIANAQDCIEENAIYIDESTENIIKNSLDQLREIYGVYIEKLSNIVKSSQKAIEEENFDLNIKPIDVDQFVREIHSHWAQNSKIPRTIIKETIRELLSPKTLD